MRDYSLKREKEKLAVSNFNIFLHFKRLRPLVFLETKLASPISAINYCHDSSIRAIRFIHTSVSFEKKNLGYDKQL